jgi:FHS family glucose/mannose:H+ symporter-like MFS transporter
MALYSGSEKGSWGWMSTFLKENPNFTSLLSSIGVAVFWFGMIFGRFIFGFLAGRCSPKKTVCGLTLLSIAAVLCSELFSVPWLIFAVVALMGLAFSGQWPFLLAMGSSSVSGSDGAVNAMIIAGGGIGSAIIPYTQGLIAGWAGTTAATFLPALCFAGIFLLLTFVPTHVRSMEK